MVNKTFLRGAALAALACTALTLGACSNDKGSSTETTQASSSKSATESSADVPASSPDAAALNQILAKAIDPNTTPAQKAELVENGDKSVDLFEKLAEKEKESGATFTVVDPVLPGYTADSVLATINYQLPNQPSRTIDNVEFLYTEGQWKLSQSWACTLAENALDAAEVPSYCSEK